MPDQRSVMKEYRFLDEKRRSQGLSPEEEARYARLRDLVGPEFGAGGIRPGFDVNAAAAQLRESLLPAGLRNRPPPTPEPSPEPLLEEPAPAPEQAFEQEEQPFEQAPFAPAEGEAPAQADGLFDPSSLMGEPPPYDPNAAAFDPNAPPYDPNAPGYDPSATYDPNAPLPADFGGANAADAAGYDPNAQPAWDPNQPWDPNATQPEGFDPNLPQGAGLEYQADPGAAFQEGSQEAYAAGAGEYDPNAQPAWDPNQPWDPNAAQPGEYAASGLPYDPGQAYPEGSNAAYPADPSLATGLGEEDPNALPALDPNQPWDASVEPSPGEPSPPEGGSFVAGDLLPPAGWDAEPALPEAKLAADFGEYDAQGTGTAFGEDAGIAGQEPLPTEAMLAEPALEAQPPAFGEYDDSALFAQGAPLEATEALETPAELLPEPELPATLDAAPAFQPAAALDGDFLAESGGSFGAGADAAAPEWASGEASRPWEGAPLLDLGAPLEPGAPNSAATFEVTPSLGFVRLEEEAAHGAAVSQPDHLAGEPAEPELLEPIFTDSPSFELGQAEEGEAPQPLDLAFEMAPGAGEPGAEAPPPVEASLELSTEAPLDAAQDEIPVVDGVDILEEVVEDSPAPPPQSLDFEPLLADVADLPAAPGPLGVKSPDAFPSPRAAAAPAPFVAPAPVAKPAPVVAPTPVAKPAPFVAPAPAAPPPTFTAAAPRPLAPPIVPPGAATEPPAPDAAEVSHHVLGSHRVVVHTVEGLVRRGVLEDVDLEGPVLRLAPQPGAAAEELATDTVKAIFFMLSPGEKPPPAQGKKVRVTFRDGRQVAGFSSDYREDGFGFFMIPGDTRTNTGRIWVYRAALRQVAVS